MLSTSQCLSYKRGSELSPPEGIPRLLFSEGLVCPLTNFRRFQLRNVEVSFVRQGILDSSLSNLFFSALFTRILLWASVVWFDNSAYISTLSWAYQNDEVWLWFAQGGNGLNHWVIAFFCSCHRSRDVIVSSSYVTILFHIFIQWP